MKMYRSLADAFVSIAAHFQLRAENILNGRLGINRGEGGTRATFKNAVNIRGPLGQMHFESLRRSASAPAGLNVSTHPAVRGTLLRAPVVVRNFDAARSANDSQFIMYRSTRLAKFMTVIFVPSVSSFVFQIDSLRQRHRLSVIINKLAILGGTGVIEVRFVVQVYILIIV